MKAKEIQVGGLYVAKVSGKLTTVKVTAIRKVTTYTHGYSYSGKSSTRDTTVYDVLNVKTGRNTTFRSAMKFRGVAKPAAVELTEAQKEIVTRQVEFSVNGVPMESLVKAFPSVTFVKNGSNAGVTWMYALTGPTVWLDKIEKKYAYGAGCPIPACLR